MSMLFNLINSIYNADSERTMHLNGTPYEIWDVGEGKCNMVLVDKLEGDTVARSTVTNGGRNVFVNVSNMFASKRDYSDPQKIDQFIADIYLLLDKLWIGQVKLDNWVDDLDIWPVEHDVALRNVQFI